MSERDVDFDTVMDLCRERPRRIVLATLAGEQRPLTVNDLTKRVLRYDHQSSITEMSDGAPERVQLSLHHEHVPKLESAGVVDYDPDRKRVKPTEKLHRLQPFLSAIVDADPALESQMGLRQ